MFRDLKADEIDCRVSTVSAKGCSLLLYKDARVDMNILDETFGVYGWSREHKMIGDRLYCTVGIRDKDSGEWVYKQDVGTESYTEKEKGQASDSFKRACFNIGIGRELYTAPFIWISSSNCNLTEKNGKWTTYDRFAVSDIAITDKKITGLVIVKQSTRNDCELYYQEPKVVYSYGTLFKTDVSQAAPKQSEQKQAVAHKTAPSKAKKNIDPNRKINAATVEALEGLIAKTNSDRDAMLGFYGIDKLEDMTNAMAMDCGEKLKGKLNGQ